MKIYRPAYIKNFKCNGKSCGSRCCRDWKIFLDDETRQKYLTLPDREEIFRVVDESAQVFKMQESGACPFLDENFLCKLQLEHGEDFLPAICQSFPCVTYKLGEEIFIQSMTLTCPVAAILILLREEPIAFEIGEVLKARQIFDFTERISEAEKFLERQQAAIKILQRRDLSINERLENFCEFFGEKISADFDEKNHATTLAEIFGEMYDAHLTADKKKQLVEIYLANRKDILNQLRENFSTVLENYLVNEFFMRLYPYAFRGDEKFNCRVFVTVYRAIEFAAVLTAIAKARLTLEDFLELLCALNDKLDHSKGGMNAIKTFAASEENFYLMIER
ncbi:MAG: flagellin lysine-N-methylase [Selenomonadaceae bacterium]|nr:flagellin lysine-N-methylase [Selenomonadaceae bacterium]